MARACAADAWVSFRSDGVPTALFPVITANKPSGDHEQAAQRNRGQRRDLLFELQFLHALLETRLKGVGTLSGFVRVEAGIRFACLFLKLELLGPMIPVADLLGQTVLNGCLGLGNQIKSPGPHFRKMLGHNLGNRIALGLLLQFPVYPCAFRPRQDCIHGRLTHP